MSERFLGATKAASLLAMGTLVSGCAAEIQPTVPTNRSGDTPPINAGNLRENCVPVLGETLLEGKYLCWVKKLGDGVLITVRYCSPKTKTAFERTTDDENSLSFSNTERIPGSESCLNDAYTEQDLTVSNFNN
jgi:hypothetical protein